ncbi:PLDc N-terminal domain-containing protein [Sporolactobacillus pectinivorans]|uniref:PLDc N-terminal domain-containing protein n=1 Tax=Sporolactobacillus pectinivorans TaxID=1591408 RepID=UPI000C25C003|nr:PLDc N-terminal domain-containing protein [Sporolactobacillus pectinivorans]
MTQISNLLPLLIPIIVLELILIIAALIHIFRHKTYRFGNRLLWVIIVLCFQLIGPIVYFIFGRGDD